MTRRLLLVRKPAGTSTAGFAIEMTEVIGAAAARRGPCSVYVPDDELDAVKSPFPKGASFDAMLDVEGEPPALGDLATGSVALRVEERRLKTYPRDWPAGARSPGFFLVSAVHRAAALDRAAFDVHWRDSHGPLALRHHAGMWDYRQAVVVDPGGNGFDGIARLGFPSVEAFETRFFDSREGRRAIGEDTLRFVDPARTEIRLLREIVLAG